MRCRRDVMVRSIATGKVRQGALACARHRAQVTNDDREDRRRGAFVGYTQQAALRATAKRFSPNRLRPADAGPLDLFRSGLDASLSVGARGADLLRSAGSL